MILVGNSVTSRDFFMAPSDSISCAISGGNGRTSGNLRSGIIWRRPGKNQAGGGGGPLLEQNLCKGLPKWEEKLMRFYFVGYCM